MKVTNWRKEQKKTSLEVSLVPFARVRFLKDIYINVTVYKAYYSRTMISDKLGRI